MSQPLFEYFLTNVKRYSWHIATSAFGVSSYDRINRYNESTVVCPYTEANYLGGLRLEGWKLSMSFAEVYMSAGPLVTIDKIPLILDQMPHGSIYWEFLVWRLKTGK